MYYRFHENISFRIVAGEAVIVNLKSGQMTVLNESGSYLWCMLDGGKTISEISEIVCSTFHEATPYMITSFAEELYSSGLLERNELGFESSLSYENNSVPSISHFSVPEIVSSEKLETLAGVCSSGYTGEAAADCRTSGLGCWDIAT